MRSIQQVNGWHWPARDEQAYRIIPLEAERDIPGLLAHVVGRNLIVQAGGNTGWWANILAGEFAEVLTIEPDPTNYACLLLNALPSNVRSAHAALWSTPGWVTMDGPEDNCGAVQVNHAGVATIRAVTVDSFDLTACDALWLDVEGSELAALRGAEQTLRRFWPVVVAEEKGLGKRYGNGAGDIGEWLTWLGYRRVAEAGRDVVYSR